MDYPVEILPNLSYKIIDCDLSEQYLIRLTNTRDIGEIWDTITNTVKIQYVCSPSEHISDLSTSLFGIYNTTHIFLSFTSEGKIKYVSYCPPDEVVDPPIFEIDFHLNENRHYWCVLIKNLANKAFSYTRSNDPFTAICLVVHTPAKWNFWHFSLRWQTDLGLLEDLEEKLRNKIARRIAHTVRSAIAQFAIIHEPEHTTLFERCYTKG